MKARPRKEVFGTKEWAQKTANCISGCAHDCKYCYAKSMAIRFKRKTEETWKDEEVRPSGIKDICSGKPCRVMFPSTHDITPEHSAICMKAMRDMLEHGHELLVVTKPHKDAMSLICTHLRAFREKILFRFTIGSTHNDVLEFWEPNAPRFEERLASLVLAHELGFATSVSCEPMLDDKVEEVVEAVSPYVTDSIWIGKANQLRQRLKINGANEETLRRGDELIAMQSDDHIQALYSRLKDHPKVKWKESIKKVVGIEIPQEAGLDI